MIAQNQVKVGGESFYSWNVNFQEQTTNDCVHADESDDMKGNENNNNGDLEKNDDKTSEGAELSSG